MSQRKPMPDNLNKLQLSVMDALQGVKTKPLGNTEGILQPLALEPDDNNIEQSEPRNETPTAAETSNTKLGLVSENAEEKTIKLKVNLYLNSMIKRRTEKAQDALRDLAPPELTGQINYSMIVETALKIVLDEFDRTGRESQLSREVMRQLGKTKLKK